MHALTYTVAIQSKWPRGLRSIFLSQSKFFHGIRKFPFESAISSVYERMLIEDATLDHHIYIAEGIFLSL